MTVAYKIVSNRNCWSQVKKNRVVGISKQFDGCCAPKKFRGIQKKFVLFVMKDVSQTQFCVQIASYIDSRAVCANSFPKQTSR